MIEEVRVLSARREYIFESDQIRLSSLNTSMVRNLIQTSFGFNTVQDGSIPLSKFGPPSVSFPPSVAFSGGTWIAQDKTPIFIRGMGFETQQLIIDIVGNSAWLDPIFAHLREILDPIKAGDGTPLLGTGKDVSKKDYSELSFRVAEPLALPVPPAMRSVFSKWLAIKDREWIPLLRWQAVDLGAPFPGDHLGGFQFNVVPRLGSNLINCNYFSSAPLDSEKHQSFLKELIESISAK